MRQRAYGLALGYEDLNDHDTLRGDPAWQTAPEGDDPLASSPTLCRLEQRASRQAALAFHQVLLAQLIASFATPPAELTLDFDATDDRAHGRREGRFFNGYYGDHCFLPLYVFCGEALLVSYLRPGNIGAARHSRAILRLLVKALRKVWPGVRILFRGDSGFCRWKLLRWCEKNQVNHLVGLAKNVRPARLAQPLIEQAESAFVASQEKQRLFGWLEYGAESWDKKRRVVLKAEHTGKGRNPRYLVTNLEGDARSLYEETYRARGEMENRVKEQQLGLFADRTSCSGWRANQFRLLLSGAACVLLETIRRVGLGHGAGPRPGGNHPPEVAQDRRGGHAQHPARPPAFERRLSPPSALCPSARAPEQRVKTHQALTPAPLLLGRWGRGRCAQAPGKD